MCTVVHQFLVDQFFPAFSCRAYVERFAVGIHELGLYRCHPLEPWAQCGQVLEVVHVSVVPVCLPQSVGVHCEHVSSGHGDRVRVAFWLFVRAGGLYKVVQAGIRALGGPDDECHALVELPAPVRVVRHVAGA